MTDSSNQPVARPRRSAVKSVLGETLIVAFAGALIALIANGIALALTADWIAPLGLKLTRNYFPAGSRIGATNAPAALLPGTAHTNAAGTNALPPAFAQPLAAELKSKGLQLIERDEVWRLFQDPRRLQDTVVFVDARNEEQYREGHIPGAYEFDPYRPEKYFAGVLPLCQSAEQIVVYCNGGDCDDSESAAITLRDVGIANGKLLVYAGGIADWAAAGQPVETGSRNSGHLRGPEK